jgi:hypothetical protein
MDIPMINKPTNIRPAENPHPLGLDLELETLISSPLEATDDVFHEIGTRSSYYVHKQKAPFHQ